MTGPTDPGGIRNQIRQIASDPDLDASVAIERIRDLIRRPVKITIGTAGANPTRGSRRARRKT